MQKTSIGFSLLTVITVPLAIILLSSNIALRIPLTYQFYFTDKQAISSAGYEVTESQLSHEIAASLNSVSGGKFQVYEKNGQYKDPIFGTKDQEVVSQVRKQLNKELAAGIFALIASLLLFEFTLRKKMPEWLTAEGQWASGIVCALLLLQAILVNIKSFRLWLYSHLVGITLKKSDALYAIMHLGFAKAYLVFSTLIAVILLLLFVYILVKRTKPKGMIFYQ
ncbi:MAG: hypothetical protein LKE44_05485 [Eubacterium sp.]|jgi:hypothetical protein|nr:hypothetical protein [Eubacterium sp.]